MRRVLEDESIISQKGTDTGSWGGGGQPLLKQGELLIKQTKENHCKAQRLYIAIRCGAFFSWFFFF